MLRRNLLLGVAGVAVLGVTGVWLTFPAVECVACALSLIFIKRS